MWKVMKNIISILLSLVIIICIIIIGMKNYNYYKDKKAYDEIREMYINEVEDYSAYDRLNEVNEDYRFWINVPDTVIDYPVVQSTDNDYYLKRNFSKEDSISGTIFLDNNNNISEDRNLILYGHNMRNGSMFAEINKFKEEENFKNGLIDIIIDNSKDTYEVFSVFVTPSQDINLKNSFISDEEFNEYIQSMRDKSIFNKEYSEYKEIITLYTCSYEYDNARTIVCAGLK